VIKVLYFSNTPALGRDYISKEAKIRGTGGWMYSLNEAIQDEVDLSLAFHYPYNKVNFKYQKTQYYPIYTGNIIVENLKKRFLGNVYDTDFLDQYLRIIDTVKPDIIHIHGTENAFLCILGKVNVPVVISIQGNLTVIQHKYLAGYYGNFIKQKNDRITLKSLVFGRNSFNKGYKTMQKMAKIEQSHLKYAKNIIGRTAWDSRITSVLSPKSTYYSGNEMLRDKFYTSKWNNNYESGKIILFTTSGNSYYKGFETLCHCLNILNDRGLSIEWRVAGISKDSLINKITKQHLGENYPKLGLMLLGSIEENNLIRNMQKSHLYIMPSHIENSPNNLCEAMIIGMPCVATFAGGTPSMLKDGEEGVLVQDGDPWVMAGAILEIINNSSIAEVYAKNARERALKRHDKATIILELIETYSKIIKNQQ
jgi:glycosyltransferase involved in cell wall biosynthesis